MSLSDIIATIVAWIGAAAIFWRGLGGLPREQAVGNAPTIPPAKPQGNLPTLKMPTARGRPTGRSRRAWAGGQRVRDRPEASALDPGLPNGDVLAAKSLTMPDPPTTLFDYAMVATMRRAAAAGVSPNRITLLRDADRDSVAETRETFLSGLNQPFGMALLGATFYVGNTDGVVAFPYQAGATRITAPGRKLTAFKPGGH